MRFRTLPVFLAFLAMGFGDAVGPFVGLAKNEFQLSNTVATLVVARWDGEFDRTLGGAVLAGPAVAAEGPPVAKGEA